MVLGTKQLDKLHTRECNIIKSALNLSTRLESSELMNSLGIERINEKVDIIFFFKNHEYIKTFITNMINICPKLSNKSIIKFIIDKFKSKNITELDEKCKLHKDIVRQNSQIKET